ncbi:hypothetical protein [Prolixibacter sp. SD074]|jgi:hypothetical protein|uniref:hypothetical protein n=1 Tax=Prolixibacter sp. SD074 TaxID=2652391 RepID=UPI00126DF3FF|nr:hypothetical protein [Prolixibacter sp. SD074]GET30516.1 hypothetical protein SD074_27180 [Prolixibacter sp. SD074]
MATVIINERTKAGKALLEYLKNTGHATVVEKSPATESVTKGLSELGDVLKGKRKGTSARKFLSEL